MCTRPDHRSVHASAHALIHACAAAISCLAILVVAIVLAPARAFRGRRTRPAPPAPIAQIDVQVHLEDAKCVAQLKRVIRNTLRRAAKTWASVPLPVDRVVVGMGFPTGGKVDLYDNYPGANPPTSPAGQNRPFTVVSLGLRDGDRELEPAEIAGALAAQIQAVIDDLYRRRKTIATPTAAPLRTIVSSAEGAHRPPVRTLPLASAPPEPAVPAHATNGVPAGNARMPRLQDYIATMQEGQPLEAAGPSSNGTHP
jgi:hypothetical protein